MRVAWKAAAALSTAVTSSLIREASSSRPPTSSSIPSDRASTPREMVRAHAYPVLAAVGTTALVVMWLSARRVARGPWMSGALLLGAVVGLSGDDRHLRTRDERTQAQHHAPHAHRQPHRPHRDAPPLGMMCRTSRLASVKYVRATRCTSTRLVFMKMSNSPSAVVMSL